MCWAQPCLEQRSEECSIHGGHLKEHSRQGSLPNVRMGTAGPSEEQLRSVWLKCSDRGGVGRGIRR